MITQFDQLVASVITIEERDELLAQLELLNEHLFLTDETLPDKIRSTIRSDFAPFILSMIKSTDVKKNTTLVEAGITQLKNELVTVPVVTIQAPAQLTLEDLSMIKKDLYKALNRHLYIKYETDVSLIAGAVIHFNGRFKDYSVKSQVDFDAYIRGVS
jgi:F0F1-type ATP synthase delta subunit